MLQDCKYRLPCNWCDKYDRMCEAVLFEIHKEEQEKNVGRPEPKENECEHEWYFDSHIISMGVEKEKHVCNKCGEVKWTDGIWLK